MTPMAQDEVVRRFHALYRKSRCKEERSHLLDELCAVIEVHRKHAIRLLNGPEPDIKPPPRRSRGPSYPEAAIRFLAKIWVAAHFPCSLRLRALLPLWLPQARKRFKGLTPELEAALRKMSTSQMERRLASYKQAAGRRIYGHTKPGGLLKHQIAIKTDHGDVSQPGYVEVDLVSHSGPNASGDFVYSLNLTDIHTGWVESASIMGKGEAGVVCALDALRQALPFTLRGLHSDNGSEFINYHLEGYCKKHRIEFTRSRPCKKNDNAHIEQKNWTHVRKLMGWDRYDSQEALEAMNTLYRGALRLMMNLYQPAMKLTRKERIGSRIKRKYSNPQTPLDRLVAYYRQHKMTLPPAVRTTQNQRDRFDPFTLSEQVDRGLEKIHQLRRK